MTNQPTEISIEQTVYSCQEVDQIKEASLWGNGGIGEDNRYPEAYTSKGDSLGAEESPSVSAGDSNGDGLPPSSLVPTKNNCNSEPHPCGCWIWKGTKEGESLVHPFVCHRWACPRCGKVNRWRLLKAIGKQAEVYHLQRLLTLTIDPSKVDRLRYTPSVYLLKTFAKFRVYLQRKYGQRVVYLWVKERGKGGGLHLHCLVDRYLPQKWVSLTWSRLGGGQVVDIRWVDLHRVRAYLTKYLSKEFYLEVDGRRYGSALGVDLCLRRKSDGVYHWELWRLPCHHFVDSPELDALRERLLSLLVRELSP